MKKFHKKNLIKDGRLVFKNNKLEDMFDHLMIDKILTKEVEKLKQMMKLMYCYLVVLIQYLLFLLAERLGKKITDISFIR